MTLTHGDYKPDNFFFATAQGGVPFAVVDWQVYVSRRGVFDVAYFLCGGIRSEIRQRKEMDWLRSYHGILLENGVRDYAFAQCLFDYRLSLLLRLIRLIGVMGNSSFSQEQENLFQRILLPRCCSAILDFDARAVLADLDRLIVKEGRLRYY